MGIKGVMLAMGPIGWAIMGVTTFMGLFATNAFGMRDAINSAGEAIGNAVPILRPLLEMLGNLAKAIFPEAEQSSKEMQFGVTNSFDQVSGSATDMSMTASNEIQVLAANVDKQADKIVSDANRIAKAFKKIGVKPSVEFEDIMPSSGGSKTLQQQFAEGTPTNFAGKPAPMGIEGVSGRSFEDLVEQGQRKSNAMFAANNIFPTQLSTSEYVSKNTTVNITVNGDVSGEELIKKVTDDFRKHLGSTT